MCLFQNQLKHKKCKSKSFFFSLRQLDESINRFSCSCLIGVHRLVCGWMMDGCKPAWRFCALKSSGEVEIQGIIKNIEKETKGRKGNSSPFLEPEPLTRNGCLSVFVFPAEMCTITVTKQNLPLHNRPAQTLSLRPRACCCACQTRTHQRVEGSKID